MRGERMGKRPGVSGMGLVGGGGQREEEGVYSFVRHTPKVARQADRKDEAEQRDGGPSAGPKKP